VGHYKTKENRGIAQAFVGKYRLELNRSAVGGQAKRARNKKLVVLKLTKCFLLPKLWSILLSSETLA
jgi:hypothetical protein